jgi:3-oxoacyl-[acyl-carrier protein] reductase
LDLGLKGVGAAVAGSSRGLGYAVALELSREGAAVVVGSRDLDAAKAAADTISDETGNAVHPVAADVSKEEQAKGFVEEAASVLGGLGVLVANAGGPEPGGPTAFTNEQWKQALDLNFFSTVNLSLAALPHLKEREWGRIVCITSNVVKQPATMLSLSSAARAAATAFAKTLADTVASDGITVNCVMPGQIVTDRLRRLAGAPEDAGADHEAFSSMIDLIPAGRLGIPEEFAAAVAFLCSERASFINGVSLAVDGGFLRGLV